MQDKKLLCHESSNMDIKTYNSLTSQEKERLYTFTRGFVTTSFSYDSFSTMDSELTGPVFNQGACHFSAWESGMVKASLGVITRDIPARGEAFIAGVKVAPPDQFTLSDLLQHALKHAENYRPQQVNLGLPAGQEYLEPQVIAAGFTQTFDITNYRFAGKLDSKPTGLDLANLALENSGVFQQIYNDAFVNSPNGASIIGSDLEGYLDASEKNPGLLGVAYWQEQPIGVFELAVKQGNIGWIEAIAITPEAQGQGFGSRLLTETLRTLTDRQVAEIKLIVVSTNTPAVRLYTRHGFLRKDLVSVWYRLVTKRN